MRIKTMDKKVIKGISAIIPNGGILNVYHSITKNQSGTTLKLMQVPVSECVAILTQGRTWDMLGKARVVD